MNLPSDNEFEWERLKQSKVLNAAAVISVGIFYGLWLDPSSGSNGIPCLWKTLLKIECLGCGLSRAWAHVVRGNLRAAWVSNWLIYPLLLVFVARTGRNAIQEIRCRN